MHVQPKAIYLILFSCVMVVLVYLASGINQLQFQPGRVFDLHSNLRAVASLLILIILILILCLLILRPKSKQSNSIPKKTSLLSIIIQCGILFIIICLINRRSYIKNIQPLIPPNIGTITQPNNSFPAHDISEYPPNVVANSLVFFALILLGVIIWQSLHGIRTKRTIRDEIETSAQQTLDAVQGGGNLVNTIIQCYSNMCRILKQHFEIERNSATTTREFENRLIGLGFPEEAVINLTRLFEDVRYGANIPSKIDENRAINSLQAIVHSRDIV